MTKSARWLLAAVTLTFCLIAAACGDDSDSSASSSAPAASSPADSTASSSPSDSSATGTAPAIVFKPLDAGGPLTTGALENGDIDIALLFSSQGIIAQNGWVILADDKKLQPVDNLVPVVRSEIASTPGVSEALNQISAALDDRGAVEAQSRGRRRQEGSCRRRQGVPDREEHHRGGERQRRTRWCEDHRRVGELQRAGDRRQHVRAHPAEQQRGRDDEVPAR